MIPSRVTLAMVLLWTTLALAASLWKPLTFLWVMSGVLIGVVLLIDAILLLASAHPEVERTFPSGFALGVPTPVNLIVRNRTKSPVRFQIHDGIPLEAESPHLPWHGIIPAKGFTKLTYDVIINKRGQLPFGQAHVLTESPLRLWKRRTLSGGTAQVLVYPNYAPVIRFSLLAMENRESQTGIITKHRHGMSREFHQIRDYHEGDSMAQIDWKSTSKRMALMSREYSEQRDQNILLLIDCSRRMRAQDGELPQFDHCLNAALLLSFLALRQGDTVAVMSYGGVDRWLPPVKGTHAMKQVLNHLYNYQTTGAPGDFAEAAERIMIRQKRRSLIVALTNLRSEDASDLLPSLQFLRTRHLVILASLRESLLLESIKKPVNNLDDALGFGSTFLYFRERDNLLKRLRAAGVYTVDETANNLPVALANQYLAVKSRGIL
jgi:uncharacterized protein (DUF58 family)